MPPDSLNRIRFRCVFWQEVERDPMSPALEVFGDSSARMKGCVVTYHVYFPVPSQPTTQVVEVGQKQLRIPSRAGRADDHRDGSAGQRPRHMPLHILSWC